MVRSDEALALLERAPAVLRSLYDGLPEVWLEAADPGEWSAHAVLVHLVTVEDHAWVQRIEHTLEHPGSQLPQINRGGPDPSRRVGEMLDRFAELRATNLDHLGRLDLRDATAVHRELGPVTVDQILATWAVHDLNHTAQALAAISSRYRSAVGPFIPNLGILGPSG